MKRRKIRRRLEEALELGHLIDLRRRFGDEDFSGSIVGLSNDWLLLHEVYDARFQGWSALRIADLKWVRRDRSFVSRALTLDGLKAQPLPALDLDSVPALLRTASQTFPLITLYEEVGDPGSCYIGRVFRLGRRRVRQNEISPAAEWNHVGVFRYDNITRIGMGGPYAEALWKVGGHDAPERDEREL